MNRNFKELNLQIRYRSGDNKALPKVFYNLVMPYSVNYYRAVGFFTSRCFIEISEGITKFIKNKGKIKLITSPKLNEEDFNTIQNAYKTKEEVFLNALEREMSIPENIQEADRLDFLSNLIEHNILEIKIAVTDNIASMYHEKIGIFEDLEGNKIVISGSNNESENAISENFESFDVYTSWNDEERVSVRSSDFDTMWENKQNSLEVFDFPEFTKKFIVKYKKTDINNIFDYKEYSFPNNTFFNFPSEIQPRQYQRDAINQFCKNDFQCLYAMATGTGKTLTSLFTANVLAESVALKNILIIVPLKDLVDQWKKDIDKYFTGTVISIRSGINWQEQLENFNILNLLEGDDNKSKNIIITTYESYSRNYQKILSSLKTENTLIIADEVHKFGTENYSSKLPMDIKYRIGLSATPKRPYDNRGTKAIFDYFCPSDAPFEFSIKDAISKNMLCHYNYYPITVCLTDDEMEDYNILSEKISRMIAYEDESDDDNKQLLDQMLKERHRIIERASNKKEIFLEVMLEQVKNYKDKTIVFTPDGKDENNMDYLSSYKKGLWQKLIAQGKIVVMNEYVQGTEREVIEQFKDGAIDILFAKQRLNEGIDIPAAKRAFFIASSTSEREFIQRRGRVLRLSPGKTLAEIFDFIVVPIDKNSKYARTIIDNEIKRAMDFALTADNTIEIEKKLKIYL